MRHALLLFPTALISGCGAPESGSATDPFTGYLCEDGKYFRLELEGTQARVTSTVATHTLEQAWSFEGTRYESGDAVLILRDEEASLRGVPEGPFEACRAMRRSSPT